MPANSPPNSNPPAYQARRIKALDLRLSGASYRQIAAALSTDVGTAHKDVQRALRETMQEAGDGVRKVEVARLDRLLLAVWPKAVAGDTAAVHTALRIMERRAVMLGLDAPLRIDMAGEARAAAERAGLDPDAVVAAVEAIVREARA